jgi:ubiquinone/menaquinone biosynthesis C-methylase UbiE
VIKIQNPWNQESIATSSESIHRATYKREIVLKRRILNKLLDRFGKVENLLEVGCGTSYYTRWFESLGLECYGLDLSHFMLREAKKLWPDGSLLQGESRYLPFKSKSFDVVVFIACLEYMPNIAMVFREAARVAKKGIVLGLMNEWSFRALERTIKVKTGKKPYYANARFYSILDMKRMLRDALNDGYNISYWSTTVFPKIFGDNASSVFPFGAFLGIAVGLCDKSNRKGCT